MQQNIISIKVIQPWIRRGKKVRLDNQRKGERNFTAMKHELYRLDPL